MMVNLKAWDTSLKKMSEIRGFVDNNQTIKIFYKSGGFASFIRDKIIIIQGSGLNDKNGNEIFDGDIHSEKTEVDGKMVNSAYQIFYENGAFWIDGSYAKDRSYSTILNKETDINIIGNIYANKKLLK